MKLHYLVLRHFQTHFDFFSPNVDQASSIPVDAIVFNTRLLLRDRCDILSKKRVCNCTGLSVNLEVIRRTSCFCCCCCCSTDFASARKVVSYWHYQAGWKKYAPLKALCYIEFTWSISHVSEVLNSSLLLSFTNFFGLLN